MARVKKALALRELGYSESSIRVSEEAISELEEMGDVQGKAFALVIIGNAQAALHQFDKALSLFESALNLNPSSMLKCDITNLIGDVYLSKAFHCTKTNNYGADALLQKCKKYFIESRNYAVKMNSENRVLQIDVNLARTYAFLDKNEQGLAQFFDNLLDRAKKSKHKDLGIIYLAYSEYLYRNEGEFTKAIKYGLEAENLFAGVIQKLKDEEAILTRKDLFERKCSKLLQICYTLTNSPNDALLVCERSKMRNSNVLISAGNTSNMQITIEYIKDIALRLNSSIVVFSEVDSYLFCWLILPNKIMPIKFFLFIYRTNLLNNIENFVDLKVCSIEQMRSSETFRGSRKFPQSRRYNASFKSEKDSKMFDIVLQNIEADLRSGGVNSMVIVPDGSLYNARFSCAKSINNSSIPLCFKYTLSICPSLSTILDTNLNTGTIESNNQIKRLLIIADPQSNLPFANKESELLNDLFQEQSDWNVDALIGSNATKQRVVEGLVNCNIIHIAAHANLNTDPLQVLRGSILLASCDSDSLPDVKSDSELTNKEISRLDLTKLELAFLNCCETGSGRVYSDGLVGLARAFFFAGARQVVVYRGSLPDTERTTAFMGRFYREYTQTKRADVALAAAQRAAHEAGVPEDFWAQYYVMMRHIPNVEREVPKDSELLRVEPDINWTRVPIAECIEQANQRCERANELYKRNENMAAIHLYNRALEVLETEPHAPSSSSLLSGPASPKSSEVSPAASSLPPASLASNCKHLLEARLRCHLNLAAAQLRVLAYDAELLSLDLVLTHQPENIKALFRKGRALAEKGNHEGSLAVLSRAAQLDPTNQSVKLELEKLESRLKGRMQCEQDEVRRMFTVSPAAAAPPNEKHAKLGACHKPGSVFVGRRRTVLLGGLALLAAVAIELLYLTFSNMFSPSADSALRGLPLSPQGGSLR